MPAVEAYGVEAIPAELRTARWRDLFAINFTFFLNPVMYVLGAIAVAGFGLPLWCAIVAMVLGQALAYSVMVPIAEVTCAAPRARIRPGIASVIKRQISDTTNNMSISVNPA